MNKEGMLALLRVVEKIHPSKLKMGYWFKHRNKKHRHKGKPSLNWCGTSACWLGHAVLDRKFQKITGITMNYIPSTGEGQVVHEASGEVAFRAAMMGLEISYEQASYLFGPDQSGEKEELIRRWWNVVTGRVS